MLDGTDVVFEDTHPISVFPRPQPIHVEAAQAALYDPAGTTGGLIQGATAVADLATLPEGVQTLIIGAGALKTEEQARPLIGGGTMSDALADWVARGGRAVVLEQPSWPRGLVPVQLGSHSSTMTFPQAPNHPLLRDVRAEDLKYWRGDHLVTDAEPLRPASGAGLSVVVSGSGTGIAQAPLLVMPHGDGAYLVCQLKVVSKADREPIARVLLRNLVDYAAAYPAPPKGTALYCDLPATRKKLDDLGAQLLDVTDRFADLDLGRYSLLIYASASADPLVARLGQLIPWVEGGGNVLLHGLAPDQYGKLAEVLDPALRLAPYRGHALRGVGDDPLLFSFTNEDLYWLGQHTGHSWATTTLAQTTATAAFERTLRREEAREFAATDMELSGAIVGQNRDGDGVYFASAGSGRLPVDFPESGEYVIGIVARGTPVDGTYPIGDVRVGGEPLGTIAVRSNEWELYTTFGHVDAGTQPLEVAFTNDASRPPNEDRNMYVQSVLVAPAEAHGRSAFLTRPAALVRFPKGAGAFVIDGIAWDTEEANAAKATRFISGLLTGLGARFSSHIGVIVEAEAMQPKPGMPHFSRGGGRVVIATNGYIDTEVEVARAGRYGVDLVAGGSPAQGVYPIVEVSLGDRSLGTVELVGGSMRPYRIEADLPAGVQTLTVTFTNDGGGAGEDRNLYVDQVVFYGPE